METWGRFLILQFLSNPFKPVHDDKKSRIDEDCEQLSVVADPWNLKLKPAKLKGDHSDTRCDRVQDYEIAWAEFERRFETTKRTKDTK